MTAEAHGPSFCFPVCHFFFFSTWALFSWSQDGQHPALTCSLPWNEQAKTPVAYLGFWRKIQSSMTAGVIPCRKGFPKTHPEIFFNISLSISWSFGHHYLQGRPTWAKLTSLVCHPISLLFTSPQLSLFLNSNIWNTIKMTSKSLKA